MRVCYLKNFVSPSQKETAMQESVLFLEALIQKSSEWTFKKLPDMAKRVALHVALVLWRTIPGNERLEALLLYILESKISLRFLNLAS